MKKREIRERKVLKSLIEEYIENQEPVSSGLICQKYVQEASPATIRIDLHKLEEKNLIFQPHTSAGRIPTIKGYRKYLEEIEDIVSQKKYENKELLRDILIKNYKDTPLSLHYIMQFLAKETDQLSFVAEPEISYGFLQKLEVFKISSHKLLFVVSLDSGMDKTVILKCDYNISEQQIKVLVKYVNGLRIYDIQNKYLSRLEETTSEENRLMQLFLGELNNALKEISSYYIHFDGNINFLEQPEFNKRIEILKFLSFMQRHDLLLNLMQRYDKGKPYNVIIGEDFGHSEMGNYSLLFSKYELFGVPGYLGILSPIRMDYKKNIPIIRDFAQIITETTKKGMMVLKNNTMR